MWNDVTSYDNRLGVVASLLIPENTIVSLYKHGFYKNKSTWIHNVSTIYLLDKITIILKIGQYEIRADVLLDTCFVSGISWE